MQVFEPVEPQDGKDVMVLDRLTGTISLNRRLLLLLMPLSPTRRCLTITSARPPPPAPNRAIPLTHEAVHSVYGILGIISLSLTDYVILITGLHANSPRFQGHDVHSPSCFLLLPLSSSAAATPSPQEAHLLGLVQHALDTTRLWFSYTLDLTSSMQRQNDGQTGDERFFWNWDMTRRIVDAGQSGRKDSVVEGGAESGGSVSPTFALLAFSQTRAQSATSRVNARRESTRANVRTICFSDVFVRSTCHLRM